MENLRNPNFYILIVDICDVDVRKVNSTSKSEVNFGDRKLASIMIEKVGVWFTFGEISMTGLIPVTNMY